MRRAILLGTAICGVMLAAGALADELKSGPEVGKTIPGPFHPLNVNGPSAGEKNCLI
jgi:hypothetical protein